MLLLFVCSVTFNLTQNLAYAQYFTGAVAQSTGGAGRAGAEASELTLINPAVLAHSPAFSGGLFFLDGDEGPGDRSRYMGLNIVDNNEEAIFPGALSYIRRDRELKNIGEIQEDYLNVTAGGFVYKQISLGASLIRLEQKVSGGESYEQWNGVLGFHHTPHPDFGWALVYYHFAFPGADVPQALRLSTKVAAGISYVFTELFRFRLDISREERENPDRKLAFQGGLETFLNDFIILRLGASRDERAEITRWTGGLSFNGPRFKLDYAYVSNEDKGEGAMHGVDLRIPF